MKKANLCICSILFLLLALAGCSSSDDSSVSNDSSSGTETSFNFTLTSLKKQETASSALGRQANFTADQVMTGQLMATNTDTSVVQTFDWSIYFDEDTFDVQSNKTIILPPGTYDFALLLIKGDQQYAGSVSGQAISDGTFDVPMTIRPIIGNTITDVTLLASLAEFKFQYDPAELAAASLSNPQMGIIIGGGTETIYGINSSTGISDIWINLDEGANTIALKLYDGSLQVGRSITAQESVIVSAGLNITMDLVALHGETTFALMEAGGDATFSFNIPSEVVDEAGGLGNLQVLFSLVGSNNPLDENLLTLAPDGAGDYEASIILSNKQFDNVTLSLTFTDVSASELLGSCAMVATLDTTQRILNCNLNLRRRAIIGGSLLATIGINAFNEAAEPLAGATVVAGSQIVGVTGSGAFGTEGYLKFYLPAGNHHLRVVNANKYGFVDTTSSALGIQNESVTLDIPFNEGIEVINGAMSLSRAFQFPSNVPTSRWKGLQTSQSSLTQISANVTIDQFSATGSQPKARVQLLFRPDGYHSNVHMTGVEIQLRADEGSLTQLAYVFHCVDADCVDVQGVGPVSGDFQYGMPLAVGVPHSISIEYLGDGHSFQFSVDGQTGIVDAATLTNFAFFNPADFSHGRISLRLDDIDSLGDFASMTALYDDVYVNNALYDDFSDVNVSLTKWYNWQ